MRNIRLSIGVVALMLLSLVVSAAAQQQPAGKSMPAVTLTGDAEVPGPGDKDGRGTATLTVDPDKSEVCYSLTVVNIQPATAAHIHEGAMGKAGAVKVELEAPKNGTAMGCKQTDASLIKTIMQNPANYYVNIHNAEFPQGAVRGQLTKE
jgi:CHRD domain